MGEPITLFSADGNVLYVYNRSQADNLIAGGHWYATEDEATAAAGGAVVEEPDVEESAPPKSPSPRKGKAKAQ